jgi:RNA polymerase sigma factor (sigma-70 family)
MPPAPGGRKVLAHRAGGTIDTTSRPPCPDRSDAELMAAVALQDEEALAELYRRHRASVAATTRMTLGPQSSCDDVVAEVFVRLWLAPEGFDPARGSLLSFLRLKAKSRSIDVLRSETSRTRRQDADRYGGHRPEPDVDSRLVATETATELRRAVASLQPGEAEAIQLAYFEGMSYIAVASYLNVAEGTVKSRIRRGLRRLADDARLRLDQRQEAGSTPPGRGTAAPPGPDGDPPLSAGES